MKNNCTLGSPRRVCESIKKEAPSQAFFCEFCQISRTPVYYRNFRWLLPTLLFKLVTQDHDEVFNFFKTDLIDGF